MADQAQGLRDLANRALQSLDPLAAAAVVTARTSARTIAITSGKGGVGKTNLSANLALCLGAAGTRVVVLDADMGLANTHVLMGIAPRYQLDHVLRGERRIEDILCAAHHNVEIAAGASDIASIDAWDDSASPRLVAELAGLDRRADVVLVDTGAGLSRSVRAFVLAVEEVVVVTTPEPTAIADAYATMKVVARENASARLCLVVNMAADASDAAAAMKRLRIVCRRFLGIEVEYLGWLPQDAAVPRAVRRQRPLVVAQPDCPAALAVDRIAGALGYSCGSRRGASGFASRLVALLTTCRRPALSRSRREDERNLTCPRAS